MSNLADALNFLKDSLCQKIDVDSLFNRNKNVHKWKAPWRTLLLRESVAWRLHDLLDQSLLLSRQGHLLGARILVRSAFETLAVLIYLNRSIRAVISGSLNFHEFSEKTSKLVLGSRNKTTNYEQVSIITVLKSADKRYPGLYSLYEDLSESAHPNYDGMLQGYSTSESLGKITKFENKWAKRYSRSHEDGIMVCLSIFFNEYNEESVNALEALEEWIALNDDHLEASKKKPI